MKQREYRIRAFWQDGDRFYYPQAKYYFLWIIPWWVNLWGDGTGKSGNPDYNIVIEFIEKHKKINYEKRIKSM